VNWRLLLINPLAIGAVVVAGVAGCRVAGVDPHARAAGLAAAAGLLASTLAIAPLLRPRWSSPVAPTQAALIALMLHLAVMLLAALAGVAVVARAEKLPLVGWTLVVFWATLAGVAIVAARTVRAEASTTTDRPA
jgi:hypothetical protein